MADKRKKTKRRRRRRRRGGTPAALILLCLVVAAAAILTATTVFFKVRDIRLSGSTRYSLAEITEASGLKTGDNLILFDKFSAIDRIFAACPYLDTVQMRRRLPDAMAELTPRQRQMIQLQYAEKLTVTQIAQRLGVNKSTVSRCLRRARQTLYSRLRFTL